MKEVLDGWEKGRLWCTSSARSAADLWRWFWHKIEDIGSQEIRLVKTKGHATKHSLHFGSYWDHLEKHVLDCGPSEHNRIKTLTYWGHLHKYFGDCEPLGKQTMFNFNTNWNPFGTKFR